MQNERAAVNRRDFVTTATGYALAVSPVTAWAITTPPTDLVTSDVTIPTGSGAKESMPAYVARPKAAGPHPVVIVVHEIFGLHEYVRDVCRRLALAGYYAISPYLYFRYGDATKIADIPKLRAEIVSKVRQQDVLGDLDRTVQWLGQDKAAKTSAMAITGFCWGGTVVWMYTSHNPSLKAGVAWYGRLTGEKSDTVPRYPLDIAESLKTPVLGLYGGKDQGIPLDQVESMKQGLAKGKSGSRIVVYNDADHGFHADYRPTYNEKAAKDGWQAMLGWLKEHGV